MEKPAGFTVEGSLEMSRAKGRKKSTLKIIYNKKKKKKLI